MGTWGVGIQSDDLIADVVSAFDGSLKKGGTLAAARSFVEGQFAESLHDPDEGPLFWLALAQAQWRYGALEPAVLQRVRDDVIRGKGLERWRESPSNLRKREDMLRRFLAKIESPNPRPRNLPRLIVRRAKFQAGDCLSIELDNGHYGAAVVLAADETNPEYPINLISKLDYRSDSPPDPDVFSGRRWRRIQGLPWNGGVDVAWYVHVGFRLYARRLRIAGKVEVLRGDPRVSSIYVGWHHLFEDAA